MDLPSASAEFTLDRYLPRHVLSAGHAEQPYRRDFDGVVLMLDIAGFTALTEAFSGEGAAGAERLSEILDRYFGCMTDIAVGHGGDVLDIVGDAVLVAWECADSREQIGRIAVQCGLALQAALPEIVAQTGARLRQRVSLACGVLTHFIVGGVSGKWHSLTAGAPLNEAALANQSGGADDVVVGVSLWPQLEHYCVARPLPGGSAAVTGLLETLPLPAPRSLPAAALAQDLERYVVQPVLERLRMGGARWLGEFRIVTVLFVGIPGVDCTSADALPLLQSVMEGAQRVHARLGGTPTRLSADDKGVFLLSAFGLPRTAREDDAVRAVIAAQEFLLFMREHGIAVDLGVATGPVFFADSGGAARRHAGLTGGTVNLAARLMVASHGRVLCDGASREAARAGFEFQACDAVQAKGLAEPVAVWQPSTRLIRERRAFVGIAVGRAEEITRISAVLAQVARGVGATFVLRGEAGIGKSRLVGDMAVRARERGMQVVWGAGYALETASVLFPWRQIFSQWLGDGADFDATKARQAASALVADDERLSSWLPLLDDVLPFQFPANEVTRQMTSQARAASLRTLVVGIASRIARKTPLLLVADDLHWFDDTSASLLLALTAARVPGLLVLAGTRPLDETAAMAAQHLLAEADLIDLDALSADEVGSLIQGRLGATRVAPAVVDFVAARSAGNPFYAEELSLALRSSGQLELIDGELQFVAGAQAPAALPDSLRGIIVSRIDALGAAEHLVLKVAAVVGREFSLRLINDLLPHTQHSLDLAQVARVLEREDVVRPARTPGAGYRFKHALLQDTVYGQLPFALRQELHGAVAQWIERNEADNLQPRYAELASHWELARRIPEAVGYLERSAALSLSRYANREAIAQASRALRLAEEHRLPRDAAREARCEAILGEAHNERFEYQTATAHFRQALAQAGRPQPRNSLLMVTDLSWQLLRQLGMRAGLRGRTSRDPLLPWASHIHQKLGEIAYFEAGKLPLLHATLTSLNLAERSDTVREAVAGLGALAIGFYGAGQHWLSQVYNRRSLTLAQDKGGMADIAYAQLISGVYRAAQGHWERAEQSLTQAVELYTRLGAVERWQQAYGGLCAIELMRGRMDRARDWLDKLGPVGRETPVQIAAYLSAFGTSLALATGAPLAQRVDRLRELVRVRELAQFDRVMCQGLIATVLWQGGERSAAIEMASAALDSLGGAAPAAWYLTDGLAGITQTLIDASAEGLVPASQARRASTLLNHYARATVVAGPRAALMAGRLALVQGDKQKALKHWRRGLALARTLGTGRDLTLLQQALGADASEL